MSKHTRRQVDANEVAKGADVGNLHFAGRKRSERTTDAAPSALTLTSSDAAAAKIQHVAHPRASWRKAGIAAIEARGAFTRPGRTPRDVVPLQMGKKPKSPEIHALPKRAPSGTASAHRFLPARV